MAGVFKKKEKKTEDSANDGVKVVKTEVVKETKKKAPAKKKAVKKVSNANLDAVLISPRITEKATDIQMGHNAYTFNVLPKASKTEIAQAVKAVYGVEPVKVRIVKVPSKTVTSRRGKRGVKSGGKKAYVYLKKGDSIEFV